MAGNNGPDEWLPRSPASHLMLCCCVPGPAGLLRAVEEAAMCMEVAILAATERGYGTCWMTGISHERVERVLPLPDGARLVRISPLGLPREGRALSWDSLLRHIVPQDRKPLAEVVREEANR